MARRETNFTFKLKKNRDGIELSVTVRLTSKPD